MSIKISKKAREEGPSAQILAAAESLRVVGAASEVLP